MRENEKGDSQKAKTERAKSNQIERKQNGGLKQKKKRKQKELIKRAKTKRTN